MNKVEVGLAIGIVFVLLYIGGSIYYEMANEIANNPDIEFIGPPGLQPPRLEYMAAMVLILAVAIFIILKLSPKEDENQP